MFGGRANEHAQVIALTLLHLLICVTPVATNPLTRYDHSIANTSPPRTRRRAAPGRVCIFAGAVHEIASAEPLASVDAARDETTAVTCSRVIVGTAQLLFHDYQVAVPVCVS